MKIGSPVKQPVPDTHSDTDRGPVLEAIAPDNLCLHLSGDWHSHLCIFEMTVANKWAFIASVSLVSETLFLHINLDFC